MVYRTLTYCAIIVAILPTAAHAQRDPIAVFQVSEQGLDTFARNAINNTPVLNFAGQQRWFDADVAIRFEGGMARAGKASRGIVEAIKRSGAFTIELWLRPASLNQEGPARIVSISKGTSHRNVTVGQQADAIELRLRTTKTSENGLPATITRTGTLTANWTHVVVTFTPKAEAQIYIDGRLSRSQKLGGSLDN